MSRGWDLVGMPFGSPLVVHPIGECAGNWCCIHNPSAHHMRDWPLYWRRDRACMQRLCPEHGLGHPDPDDLDFREHLFGVTFFVGPHECCGCCQPTTAEGDDQ